MAGRYIYGIDYGGTELRIYKVNPENGRLVKKILRCSAKKITSNKDLTSIVLEHIEEGAEVGISAAGNIDEKNLTIKYSPNSPIKGKITFAKELSRQGRDVVITNDMKAAVQAVARYGEGKNYKNVAVATYSSGFNAAVARNRKNVSQAELGHIPYEKARGLFCGCGCKGHLEPCVSGNGAASIAKQYFSIHKEINHPIIKEALKDYNKKARKKHNRTYKLKELEKNRVAYLKVFDLISSKHIYQAYRKYNQNPQKKHRKYRNKDPQEEIRNSQLEAIADSFGIINSAFNPLDIIVCMGSQTKDADVLFNPAIRKYRSKKFEGQLPGLKKPRVVITELPEIGVQGAVAYFQYVKGNKKIAMNKKIRKKKHAR